MHESAAVLFSCEKNFLTQMFFGLTQMFFGLTRELFLSHISDSCHILRFFRRKHISCYVGFE